MPPPAGAAAGAQAPSAEQTPGAETAGPEMPDAAEEASRARAAAYADADAAAARGSAADFVEAVRRVAAAERAWSWSAESDFGLRVHADDRSNADTITRSLMRNGMARVPAAALAHAVESSGTALVEARRRRPTLLHTTHSPPHLCTTPRPRLPSTSASSMSWVVSTHRLTTTRPEIDRQIDI